MSRSRRIARAGTLLLPSAVLAVAAMSAAMTPAVADARGGEAARPVERVSVILGLSDPADVDGLAAALDAAGSPRRERHREVVLTLREAAVRDADMPVALQQLAGGRLEAVQRFWITNAIRIDGPADAVAAAATHPRVRSVSPNLPIRGIRPVAESVPAGADDPPAGVGGPVVEPGVAAVNAPAAWAMGYDGSGILVAVIDTGVDGTHPALAGRWAGLRPEYAGHPEWAWFDPWGGQNDAPFDSGSSSHGTHVAGTVCGGPPGDGIGVAPGSHWIAAAAIDRGGSIEATLADAIESFQWMLDPDGDPRTVFDVPHVIVNSWGLADFHGIAACDPQLWSFLDAVEAAGTVVVFAAGNEGAAGLRRPADRASDPWRTFAVAAVDAGSPGFPVAGFSSRGPTTCTPDGQPAIKPDIAGPGVAVRSALGGGQYGFKSGTSMAAPHLAGVIALMRQANPDLSPQDIKQILFETAVDLAESGEDNDTGHGMVDAAAAVVRAAGTVALRFTFDGLPELIDPAGGPLVRVSVRGEVSPPMPGTGRLHLRVDGGPWSETPMLEREPNVYDAVFPPLPCGSRVEWYVSAMNAEGRRASGPALAPGITHAARVSSGVEVLVRLDFESAAGWGVVNEDLEDGAWERGVPAGAGDRGDPPIDADGSGAAWLTGNRPGNSDVDGGPTRLVSPAYDLRGLSDPVASFSWWLTNEQGGDALDVEVSGDDGLTWRLAARRTSSGGWVRQSVRVLEHLSPADLGGVRFRFSVADNPNDSVTEAGIDAFEIFSDICLPPPVPGDVDGNGLVDLQDLLLVLAAWGPCDGCPADLDGSGAVDFDDLLPVLANFSA